MGIRCSDHVTPLYPQKLALTSPTGGGRSVGIVRLRTKATEFIFLGHLISYEKELDIDNILNNYLKITGVINNVYRPYKTLKKTILKLYYALALPAL